MPEIALRVIRQSKGEDDSYSLREQREETQRLSNEVADEDEALDLGVHTGFSIHTREKHEPRIDANEEVLSKLEKVGNGYYDYIVAVEERRLARDEFIHNWSHAASMGDAEFVFLEESPEDELTKGVKRVVEREMKKREIAASKRAIKQRQADGLWQGAAPFGTEHGNGPRGLDATDEFTDVLQILNAKSKGKSHREAIQEAGLADERSASLVTRMLNNEQRMNAYQELADEEGYWFPRV